MKVKYNAIIVNKVIRKSDILVVAMSDSKNFRKIKPIGNQNFRINCFYHNDKHPSLNLHMKKRGNKFYCSACGAKGNVINLIMHIYNMGFLESVETLAAAFDVKLPDRSYDEANKELVKRLREVKESLEYKELLEKDYQKSLKK